MIQVWPNVKRRRQENEKSHLKKKLMKIYRPSVGFTAWKYDSGILGNMTWKFDMSYSGRKPGIN